MTTPLEKDESAAPHRAYDEVDGETANLRSHYEGVVRDTLRILWRGKWLIAATAAATVALAVIALALIEPRYTAQALLQLHFNRGELSSDAKGQPIAMLDAASLVDSELPLVRSRATAKAVVARLGLDEDSGFNHQSRLSRGLAAVRGALGLQQAMPSAEDLAVNELLRRVQVTREPRSYLISITAASADPEQAPKLANAFALEYLRSRGLNDLTEAEANAERELANISSIYGGRHPNYLQSRTRLEEARARLRALRVASAEDLLMLAPGTSLLPAGKFLIPSGPDSKSILGLVVVAALAAGIWLARYRYSPHLAVKSVVHLSATQAADPAAEQSLGIVPIRTNGSESRHPASGARRRRSAFPFSIGAAVLAAMTCWPISSVGDNTNQAARSVHSAIAARSISTLSCCALADSVINQH